MTTVTTGGTAGPSFPPPYGYPYATPYYPGGYAYPFYPYGWFDPYGVIVAGQQGAPQG